MTAFVRILLALLPLAGARPCSVLAQSQHATTLVTLAAVSSLPAGVRATIQRVSGRPSRNIILLTDSAGPGDLAAALSVLRDERERNGEDSDRDQVLSIPAQASRPLHSRSAERLQRHLDQLRAATPRDLGSIGRVRSVVVSVPRVLRATENRRN